MKPAASAKPRGSVSVWCRREIEKAEADGVARDVMVLRLTLGDSHRLKRDPEIALADIVFVDGAMWYLGVKVEQGGVPESLLDRGPQG